MNKHAILKLVAIVGFAISQFTLGQLAHGAEESGRSIQIDYTQPVAFRTLIEDAIAQLGFTPGDMSLLPEIDMEGAFWNADGERFLTNHLRVHGIEWFDEDGVVHISRMPVASETTSASPTAAVRSYRHAYDQENPLLNFDFWRTATVEIVAAAISKGADIHARDNEYGAPALHRAASINTNPELIEFLIDHGADILTRNKYGETALHLAANSNRNPEVVRFLLDRGADINAREEYGNSALHLALFWAEWGIIVSKKVSLLLDRGADINARDNSRETPLHMAMRVNSSLETTKILLDRDADIDAHNNEGVTPLHIATFSISNPEVVVLLLDRGADIHARNEEGETPLHWSAWRNKPNMAGLLLERGADIEESDHNDRTPLHVATIFASTPAVVELLLDKGADGSAQDRYGKTPFDYAQENEHLINTNVYWRLNDLQYQ